MRLRLFPRFLALAAAVLASAAQNAELPGPARDTKDANAPATPYSGWNPYWNPSRSPYDQFGNYRWNGNPGGDPVSGTYPASPFGTPYPPPPAPAPIAPGSINSGPNPAAGLLPPLPRSTGSIGVGPGGQILAPSALQGLNPPPLLGN